MEPGMKQNKLILIDTRLTRAYRGIICELPLFILYRSSILYPLSF